VVTAAHGPKVYTASKHAVVLVEHLADKTYRVSAREILHAAGIPDLIHAADPGSKEKLYEMISGGPPPEVDERGNVRIPDLSE